ncbi:MAG: hypothetical protein WBG17_11800 [Burkholderiaceae bacterium]
MDEAVAAIETAGVSRARYRYSGIVAISADDFSDFSGQTAGIRGQVHAACLCSIEKIPDTATGDTRD